MSLFYKIIIFIFLTITVSWTLFFWKKCHVDDEILQNVKNVKKIDNNAKLPDISFKDLNENSVKLYNFAGKIIILNFWASWCAPCEIEFPYILDIVNEYQGKIILLAISNDKDKNDIKKFLKKFDQEKINKEFVHILWDKTFMITQKKFNVVKLPETFIIDKSMNITKKIIGADAWLETNKLKEYLNSLINPPID